MALGQADVRLYAPPAQDPWSDRAPDWVADGTPEPLRGELLRALGPGRVATRALDLVRYASDASPYRTIPRAVAIPREVEDVRARSVEHIPELTGTCTIRGPSSTAIAARSASASSTRA